MNFLRIIFACGLLALMASCVSPPENVTPLGGSQWVKVTGASEQYDNLFVHTVATNWYQLLNKGKFDHNKGKVVLQFCLYSNGSVTGITVKQSNVGDQLTEVCKKAVLNGVPYQAWPDSVLKAFTTNWCDVRFAFDYY